MINQHWVFGHKAILDFSTSPPTASASSQMSTAEGCASISDASGQLLLYSDGSRVWDGNHNQVASNLQGNPSSTQSCIIVPDPGNAAEYYIFTADGASGGNKQLDGVRIDINTWAVTPLSSIMTMPLTPARSPTEKLTAIQHENCRDFWVITIVQDASTGNPSAPGILRALLVSPSGVQHVGDTPMGVPVQDVGYMKASRDGKRLALANWTNRNVLVYPFDNSTGTVDLSKLINIAVPSIPNHPQNTYGVEFSPTGSKLYYSVVGHTGPNNVPQTHGYVFQHDLFGSLPSVPVGVHPNAGGRYALGALQLAADDQIYIAQDLETTLGVIASPESPGTACGLTFSALPLAPGSMCHLGLPNMIPNPCGCACEEGNCDEAVEEANKTLNARADRKTFTIIANGQQPSATCDLAFNKKDFAPLFSLHWGDSLSDQFESHDTEVIYIRVRNPFRNLTYRGVKIFNIQVTPNQALPSGENALQLTPAEIACFDEIEPCSYVSRDFAFLIQNAVVQGYQITFDYCIEEIVIVGSHNGSASFGINVIAS